MFLLPVLINDQCSDLSLVKYGCKYVRLCHCVFVHSSFQFLLFSLRYRRKSGGLASRGANDDLSEGVVFLEMSISHCCYRRNKTHTNLLCDTAFMLKNYEFGQF